MRSETSLAFERQWSALRGEGELVPAHAAFDPVAFVDLLPVLVIAEIDLDSKTMPIILAGSAIRDFVGFELTGEDFLKYDSEVNEQQGWQHRRYYHDHPCGRYEELDVRFTGGLHMECALTILPLGGSKGRRLIAILVEPMESVLPPASSDPATIAEPAKVGVYIDVGAGVPAEILSA